MLMSVSLSETNIKTSITMTSLTVKKVNRERLSACLTCLLCNKLFTNATTVIECLHTFCRECIYKKLIDENLTHCPICDANLGCSPLDKLRSDHSLQDLREKIFPCEGQIARPPGNAHQVTFLTKKKKKKKKSLSLLQANARIGKPVARKVLEDFAAHKPDKAEDVRKDGNNSGVEVLEEASTILSARGAKAVARTKFIRTEPTPTCQLDKVVEGKKNDNHLQLETSNKTSKTRIQNSSKPYSSQQIAPYEISGDNAQLWKEKADMHEPLNCLVEAASKNKLRRNKSTMQENGLIPVLVDSDDNDSQAPKVKVNKHSNIIEAAGDQNELTPSESDSVRHQRLQSTQEKRLEFTEDLNFPALPVVASNTESNKEFAPIWFSLVASEEKKVSAQLPQIPSCYLRVKDGSLPVSYIKKYLVMKLGLASEAEVEISLHGQPILSSWSLKNLVDLWLQTVPTNEIQTSVGSSAKDFVMVLSYGRKA